MRLSRSLSFACALLFAGAASAQLKPPAEPQRPSPARPAAAPAAPAAAAPAAAAADSATAEKEEAGKLAAAGWLVLLDRRDWGRAWETSATMFRSTVPLGTWMDGIPKVRSDLGNFVERLPAQSAYKTKLEGRPDGEYVSVIFESKFSGRQVQEWVTTVREPDGKWRVTGYSTR